VQNTVQGFAKSYSDVIALMKKMRGDVLKNDPTALNSIEAQMRATLSQPADVDGSFNNVFEVGISTQKNGSLAVNAATLTSAMNNDYEGFAKLFADPTSGVAHGLRALADGFLDTGAFLDARSQGLQRQIKSQRDQKARLELRLTATQERLTKQYNRLDSVIASLNGTGSALLAQLNAMTASTQQRN
jgi:flagellar hook-associated protein 2